MSLVDATAFAAGLGLLLGGCARSNGPPRPSDRDVDALFADYDRRDAPGAAVLVLYKGEIAARRVYGLADLEARTPVGPDTNFRLASLTKQFTAAAVQLLVGRGQLGYDDRVRAILPELPAVLDGVRVRHLLNHTSGVWDYEELVTGAEQVKDRDVLRLLSRVERSYFPPGRSFRYSNSGYALLALVVERKSGQPFARFVRDNIFEPLGMHGTVAYEAGISTVAHRALGYVADGGRFRLRDQSPTSAVLGDGGIYTSVNDWVAWDRALDAHTLVAADAQELAWTPPKQPGGARYGFGWFVDDDGGRRRLSHHGETCGFTNAIVRYPRQRLTVLVLTNRAGGAPWLLAQRVADLWLGERDARPWPFETTPNAR